MNKWCRYLLVLGGVLLCLLAGCQTAPDKPLDTLVDIGSHRLFLHCRGSGSPVVVIDTGMGETYENWQPVIESLSQTTRVCAYDRAGYGQSDPGPLPRDSQRAADELVMLLQQAAVQGPYVLVGHSLGGLNMQVLAARHPEQAAGIVLLDPPPLAWLAGEGFPELRALFNQEAEAMRSAAEAARAASDPQAQAQADFLQSLASEFEQFFGSTARQAASISSFGALPLTVIGATQPDPHFGASSSAFRQFWNEASERLAEKSTHGRFVLAEGSSHQIQLDAPHLVIAEILQLVQAARD